VLIGSSSQTLGPRPELVLEMKREADAALHLVTVVGLLKEAPEYLGTSVSQSTIQEAESLPDRRHIEVLFSSSAKKRFDSLAPDDQEQLSSALELIISNLRQGRGIQDLPDSSVEDIGNERFLIRWSLNGTAVLQVKYEYHNHDIAILISNISKKIAYSEGAEI
jgi:hypothetical protein